MLSRVGIVPFSKPSLAPITDEQQQAYKELEDMLTEGMLSSVCGWAIKQEEKLLNKDEVKEMKALLRPHFQGCSASNWTFVALCLKQVRTTCFLGCIVGVGVSEQVGVFNHCTLPTRESDLSKLGYVYTHTLPLSFRGSG